MAMHIDFLVPSSNHSVNSGKIDQTINFQKNQISKSSQLTNNSLAQQQVQNNGTLTTWQSAPSSASPATANHNSHLFNNYNPMSLQRMRPVPLVLSNKPPPPIFAGPRGILNTPQSAEGFSPLMPGSISVIPPFNSNSPSVFANSYSGISAQARVPVQSGIRPPLNFDSSSVYGNLPEQEVNPSRQESTPGLIKQDTQTPSDSHFTISDPLPLIVMPKHVPSPKLDFPVTKGCTKTEQETPMQYRRRREQELQARVDDAFAKFLKTGFGTEVGTPIGSPIKNNICAETGKRNYTRRGTKLPVNKEATVTSQPHVLRAHNKRLPLPSDRMTRAQKDAQIPLRVSERSKEKSEKARYAYDSDGDYDISDSSKSKTLGGVSQSGRPVNKKLNRRSETPTSQHSESDVISESLAITQKDTDFTTHDNILRHANTCAARFNQILLTRLAKKSEVKQLDPPSRQDTKSPSSSTRGPPGKIHSMRSKPFSCPNSKCNKSYQQYNGLKYHLKTGTCSLELQKSDLESQDEILLRPWLCHDSQCGRRYKNLSGLIYHYKHCSDHGTSGQEMLDINTHPNLPSDYQRMKEEYIEPRQEQSEEDDNVPSESEYSGYSSGFLDELDFYNFGKKRLPPKLEMESSASKKKVLITLRPKSSSNS